MSISPLVFYESLKKSGVSFFTGVPDSLLKDFSLCVEDNAAFGRHIIAANEGNAVAMAAGFYLATAKIGLVYMQNSGFGNALNPLLSLCDSNVHAIPMILLVGWRGEPQKPDEPQHLKQGNVQLKLIKSIGLSYDILCAKDNNFKSKVNKAIACSLRQSQPFIFLVKKGTFEKYIRKNVKVSKNFLMREEALEIILQHLPSKSAILSTTGKTSREVFEIREKNNRSHKQDFLVVGSMGHAFSIALGIAMTKPAKKVYCIDGDGSLIMHMGSLTTVGKLKPENFCHILLNNEAHESVGGQETAAKYIDIKGLVRACGYKYFYSVCNKKGLAAGIKRCSKLKGPCFLEVKINIGSRPGLGRPTISPQDNKKAFMEFLSR